MQMQANTNKIKNVIKEKEMKIEKRNRNEHDSDEDSQCEDGGGETYEPCEICYKEACKRGQRKQQEDKSVKADSNCNTEERLKMRPCKQCQTHKRDQRI
jgi:hypothetical protein